MLRLTWINLSFVVRSSDRGLSSLCQSVLQPILIPHCFRHQQESSPPSPSTCIRFILGFMGATALLLNWIYICEGNNKTVTQWTQLNDSLWVTHPLNKKKWSGAFQVNFLLQTAGDPAARSSTVEKTCATTSNDMVLSVRGWITRASCRSGSCRASVGASQWLKSFFQGSTCHPVFCRQMYVQGVSLKAAFLKRYDYTSEL